MIRMTATDWTPSLDSLCGRRVAITNDANTIAVVDGIRRGIASLTDVPKELAAKVIFDQSDFVRDAIGEDIEPRLRELFESDPGRRRAEP